MRALRLVLLTLAPWLSPAAADTGDNLESKFGSDAANKKTFLALIQDTTHLEAGVGVFLANLSGGLTALTAMSDETGTNQAIDSIGRGEGLVRELRFGLEVMGNEAFFSYLSDQLWAEADQAVRDNVGNELAEEAILMLVGELRPNLTSLLGPDAKTWLKAEYGRLDGRIEDPWRFAVRDGEPWFGTASTGWQTNYFMVEAGSFPDGRGKGDEFKKRRPFEDTGDEGIGFFARYSRFSRPVVLGFGEDLGETGFTLQDAELTMYSLGVRYEALKCGTFCGRVSGTLIPFTSYADLDLGRFGAARGAAFGGGFELKGSLPLNLFWAFHLSPYLSFRTDFILPLLNTGPLLEDTTNKSKLWAPDYLLWGPTAGITGKF